MILKETERLLHRARNARTHAHKKINDYSTFRFAVTTFRSSL